MPATPRETVWPAKPHTIAKIRLLADYLKAWFSILGTHPPRRGRNLLYVDGFAGPGEYTNHPIGSPVVAVEAAISALETHSNQWIAGDVHCAFIELDKDRIDHLEQRLGKTEKHARVHLRFYHGTFASQLEQVRAEMPDSFSHDSPLFVFIDPFGATGVPFSAIAEVLESRCSEVLLNLDADGITRNFQNDHVLDEIFGDESWRPIRESGASFGRKCRQILSLYKTKLRALPNIQYVFSFQMGGHTELLNYHLVFASGHPLGLEKMKEAMKGIDQTGDYLFSDADIGQPHLFRFDDAREVAEKMYNAFAGSRPSYEELTKFALNETNFVNPKKMLKFLEETGRIEVKTVPGQPRRKGTFNENAIQQVIFQTLDTNA